MKTRSFLQRHTSESSDRLTANIQPRRFEHSQFDEPHPTSYDLSHVDLFSHAPQRGQVQTKLTVGAPNDVYEQEADRVAEQVMGMPNSATQPPVQRQEAPEEELQTKPLAASITPLIQREEMPQEEEEPMQAKLIQREETQEEEEPMQAKLIQREETQEEEIQTKPSLQRAPEGSLQADESLESRLNASNGSPLPNQVRSFMEPRFGTDFSQVRVHTGSNAVQMNQDLSAQAFTHGKDIYFGAGKAPANDALTAHELTHVVQQTGAVQPKLSPTDRSDGKKN